MSASAWWTTVEHDELERLRARLLCWVQSRFGPTLDRESEDVVQHAFVTLLRQREQVRPDDDGLYRYLCVVAHNYALDHLKTSRKRNGFAERAGRTRAARRSPLAEPGEAELAERARDFFCNLDELDRLVLWSHVVDGRPINAIARDLGLNWHAVARIIDRALRSLRQRLGD